MSRLPLIFLIAGEASGDQLGADLMATLQATQEVRFAGIGGEAMAAQGLQSLFPMEELSLMGFVSILRDLPNLLRRLRLTVKTIQAMQPDVVVTIDAPEFSLRVMKRLHKMPQRPRLIHYVAPTVWAWRPGLAKKVARFLDHLLCLYPFEPPYFEKHGLKATFVGHPIAQEDVINWIATAPAEPRNDGKRERHCEEQSDEAIQRDMSPKKRDPDLLCVLPGSRLSELDMLLPVFGQTVTLLKKEIPHLKVILPTLPSLEKRMSQESRQWPVDVQIVVGDAARREAFQKASIALAASGTVALQLSAAQLPFVVAYKMNKLNEWIVRLFVTTPWACMVNILLAFQRLGPTFVLNRQARRLVPTPWIPEFIQEDCTPEKITPALLKLYQDQDARSHQITAMKEAVSLLKAPHSLAAQVVLDSSPQKKKGMVKSSPKVKYCIDHGCK